MTTMKERARPSRRGRSIKRTLYAGIGLLIASSTAYAHVLDGRWGFDLDGCRGLNEGVMQVNIARGEVRYYESSCHIDQFEPVGIYEEVWRSVQTCSGEGETWTNEGIISISYGIFGEPDMLVQVDLVEGWTSVAYRCGK